MKNSLIILAAMLALPFTALRAQTEDEQKITEIQLNDHYSARLRQICASEYTARKNGSEHLRHKPYKVITDVDKARKLLRKSVKTIEIDSDNYHSAVEITFKDGVKKRFDWYSMDKIGFVAYYPEFSILILREADYGNLAFDLNDSSKELGTVGEPCYYAPSPDKQLRINGYFPSGAADEVRYFLEKWNTKKKQYEFVAHFDDGTLYLSSPNWFWASNNTLFQYGWWKESYIFYEMEIIIND